MSLTTTTNKVIYSGNGATTSWSFTFPILAASELSVIYTDTAGVETTLSSSTYTVTGIGSRTGGSVTYPTSGSPIASGTKLTILRTVPYTQTDVFSNQGGYFPEVIEGRFDRVVMALQQLYEKATRGLFAPVSDGSTIGELPTATLRANGGAGSFLAFDSSGNPYAGALTPLSSTSTWIQTNLLPATSAAAARTAIGAVGLTGNETIAGNKTLSGTTTLAGDTTSSGTVTMSGKPINAAKGADLASAATVNIGAATGNFVHITGTTTITAFDTVQAGIERWVVFDGALTLTHNATTLILPDAANILTAAGDRALFVSEGSGNWRCLTYQKAIARTASADTNVTMDRNTRVVAFTSLSAARTVTLPAANTMLSREVIWIMDESGSASSTNTISVVPSGTDTIDGSNTTQVAINIPRGSAAFLCDGSGKWTPLKWSVVYTNSLSGTVSLSNTGTWFDGPSVAQGTVGRWMATGNVAVVATDASQNMHCRLTDGTSFYDSSSTQTVGINAVSSMAVSGYAASPAGNIRIQANSPSTTNANIQFNKSGVSKDSTITVWRVP